MHMKLLKVTELASLIMNTAEKLKVQMVVAKHCCLHYLIVFSAYGSREVRGERAFISHSAAILVGSPEY